MENLNRVLLENVLPAHVAEHFLARNWKNEVSKYIFCLFFITVTLDHANFVLTNSCRTDVLWFHRGFAASVAKYQDPLHPLALMRHGKSSLPQ